jgi:hypothetical protein
VPNDQPRIANSDDPEAVVRDLLSQASEDLEPISPERALELYLEDKARDCRQSTVDSHRSRLGFLVRWCEDQGIENLNDLTARTRTPRSRAGSQGSGRWEYPGVRQR